VDECTRILDCFNLYVFYLEPCLKEAKLDDSWISDEDEIKPESEEDDKCVLSD